MDDALLQKNPLLKRIEKRNWAVLGILTLASLLLASYAFSAGIISGGLISILSYRALDLGISRTFHMGPKGAKPLLLLWFYTRLTAIALVLTLLIYYRVVDVFGLLTGLSVVVISIILTTLLDRRKISLGV